ncbi:MAG: hypothetical protein PUE49_01120 [Eggerthellales bacterium]|nr:hypothetical protein [Eggerthellales bacterium]
MTDMQENKEPESNPGPTGIPWGHAILGFLFGIFGVLITWLVTRKAPSEKKTNAILYSLVGFGIGIFFEIMVMFITGVSYSDLTGSAFGGGSTSSVW